MQDRQHRAVGRRIEKLVGMPGRGQRPGLRLAVADDAGDDQIGIVEHRPERMAERIAQLAAFVDRARALRRGVAGNSAGKRKLDEQLPQPGLILTDVGIDLAVGALEIGVAHDGRAAVPGAGDVDHVEVVFLDDPVQVRIDEVLPRRRAPVPEQHVLHVRERQRPLQQRVVVEIDLADRQIVGGAPVGVHPLEKVRSECPGRHGSRSPARSGGGGAAQGLRDHSLFVSENGADGHGADPARSFAICERARGPLRPARAHAPVARGPAGPKPRPRTWTRGEGRAHRPRDACMDRAAPRSSKGFRVGRGVFGRQTLRKVADDLRPTRSSSWGAWRTRACESRAAGGACYMVGPPMNRNDRDRPPPPTKTTEPRPDWMRDPALLPRNPPRMPIVPDRRRRDDPGA